MTAQELRHVLIACSRFYNLPVPFFYDYPEEGLRMLYDFACWCCQDGPGAHA